MERRIVRELGMVVELQRSVERTLVLERFCDRPPVLEDGVEQMSGRLWRRSRLALEVAADVLDLPRARVRGPLNRAPALRRSAQCVEKVVGDEAAPGSSAAACSRGFRRNKPGPSRCSRLTLSPLGP